MRLRRRRLYLKDLCFLIITLMMIRNKNRATFVVTRSKNPPYNTELGNILRWSERAGHYLLGIHVGDCLGIGRNGSTDGSIANAIMVQVELCWIRGKAGKAAILPIFNDVVDGNIDALQGTGDDACMDEALIGINADTENALLISSIKSADATATSNLEDDVGLVLVNMGQGGGFTLSSVSAILGIV